MSGILSASIAQTDTINISKSVEVNFERSAQALGFSVSADLPPVPRDNFQRLFDVLDISDSAQERLLKNRDDAEALAAYVQSSPGPKLTLLSLDPGKIRVDFTASEISEAFSFSETINVSLSRETTVSVKTTDGGSFEVSQTSEVEASLTRAVEILRSSSERFLSASRKA